MFTNHSQPWNWTCSTQQQNSPRKRNRESTSLCSHVTKILENARQSKAFILKRTKTLLMLVVPMQMEEWWAFITMCKVLSFYLFWVALEKGLACFEIRFCFQNIVSCFYFQKIKIHDYEEKVLNNFQFLWWGNNRELTEFGWRGVIREEISPTGMYNLRPLFHKCSILFCNTTLFSYSDFLLVCGWSFHWIMQLSDWFLYFPHALELLN